MPRSGPPQVRFRPERLAAADLAPVRVDLGVTHHGRHADVTLINLSVTGAAFGWPWADAPQDGDTLTLAIRFEGRPAWHGEVEVRRVCPDADGTAVAVELCEGTLPVHVALEIREVLRWDAMPPPPAGLRWGGAERFLGRVAELRLYLDDARERFEAMEKDLAWSILHHDHQNPAHDTLMRRVEAEFVPGFVERAAAINEAYLSVPEEERAALGEFSRRTLHATFMESPLLRRALEKPLGYPGDFELMRYIYERSFDGRSLLGRALTLAVVRTRSCEAVRARKDLLREELLAALGAARARGGSLRVLLLAGGPVQEVVELLDQVEELPAPLRLVVVEMERNALQYAHARLRTRVERRRAHEVELVMIHDRIRRRVNVPWLTEEAPFDMAYTAGLYDYLPRSVAVELTRSIYQHLRPGGQLWVGNMAPESPSRWIMDLHLDWVLNYRTHADLLELGRSAAADAECWVVPDRTGVNPFLVMRRQ